MPDLAEPFETWFLQRVARAIEAGDVPADLLAELRTEAERAREVATIVERLKPITNPNMKSDLTTATALARAAIQGALANVEINLESLQDKNSAFAADMRKQAAALTR